MVYKYSGVVYEYYIIYFRVCVKGFKPKLIRMLIENIKDINLCWAFKNQTYGFRIFVRLMERIWKQVIIVCKWGRLKGANDNVFDCLFWISFKLKSNNRVMNHFNSSVYGMKAFFCLNQNTSNGVSTVEIQSTKLVKV